MKRFYIFKDGRQQASTATKESAVELVHRFQKREVNHFIRAEFSIIEGEEEFIPYPAEQRLPKKKNLMER